MLIVGPSVPLVTSPNSTVTTGNNQLVVSETANYYGLSGTMIGTLTLNETVVAGGTTWNVYGLGIFTPATGARTPVQLGLSCSLSEYSKLFFEIAVESNMAKGNNSLQLFELIN